MRACFDAISFVVNYSFVVSFVVACLLFGWFLVVGVVVFVVTILVVFAVVVVVLL